MDVVDVSYNVPDRHTRHADRHTLHVFMLMIIIVITSGRKRSFASFMSILTMQHIMIMLTIISDQKRSWSWS